MVDGQIMQSVYKMGDQIIAFIPTLIAVILLLIIGLITGKILGKIGSKILDEIGLDDLIDKTPIGEMIKKGGISTVGLFDAMIRWFIYIIFGLIIIDMLKITIVADFISKIILFIPLLIAALLVLVIGILIVDAISSSIKKIIIAVGIDDKIDKSSIGPSMKASSTTISGIIANVTRLFGYLVTFMTVAEILQMQFLTTFLISVINYIPNLFTGIIILVVGFLGIDFVVDYLNNTSKGMNIEGIDIILPVLRGFLFLVVILLSLDTMLIKTNIFYTFLGPLAWGFALVVAFKWGVKDTLVAYARERKI